MTKKKYGVRTVNGNEPDPITGNVDLSVGGSQDLQLTIDNGGEYTGTGGGGEQTVKLFTTGTDKDGFARIRSQSVSDEDGNWIQGTVDVFENGFALTRRQKNTDGSVMANSITSLDSAQISLQVGSGNNTNRQNSRLEFAPLTPNVQNVKILIPAKSSSGNYTLATLDDISGGSSQNLQQTLDNGKQWVDGDDGNKIEFYSNDESYPSTLGISSSKVEFNYGSIGFDFSANSTYGAGIGVSGNLTTISTGNYQTYQLNNNGLRLKTQSTTENEIGTLKSDLLTEERTLQFPDKSGTIATLEDLNPPSLNQVLSTGNSFTDNQMKAYDSYTNTMIYVRAGGVTFQGDADQLDYTYNGINYSIGGTGKINKLTFSKDTAGASEYKLPNKEAGVYTLATKDDISQIGLTEVLMANNTTYTGVNFSGAPVTIAGSGLVIESNTLFQGWNGGAVYTNFTNEAGKFNINNFTGFKQYISSGDWDLELLTGSAKINGNKVVTTADLAVNNATASPLSATDLNTAYPNAVMGFRVQCVNPAMMTIYEKTQAGWVRHTVNSVAP